MPVVYGSVCYMLGNPFYLLDYSDDGLDPQVRSFTNRVHGGYELPELLKDFLVSVSNYRMEHDMKEITGEELEKMAREFLHGETCQKNTDYKKVKSKNGMKSQN